MSCSGRHTLPKVGDLLVAEAVLDCLHLLLRRQASAATCFLTRPIPTIYLRGKPGETKASGGGAGWGKPAPHKVCCGGTSSKLLASALNKGAAEICRCPQFLGNCVSTRTSPLPRAPQPFPVNVSRVTPPPLHMQPVCCEGIRADPPRPPWPVNPHSSSNKRTLYC